LATLDSMLSNSFALGFGLLTLGLVFAIMWASIYAPTGWLGDPSITISVFTWGLLLITMVLRTSAGWRGRKAAVMALAVLGSSALTWVAHAGLGATLAQ
jgi:ABC-type transport system involved in cytochrome c biogenesis permease subunit